MRKSTKTFSRKVTFAVLTTLLGSLLSVIGINQAQANVAITELNATSWQANTGSTLTTTSLWSNYAALGWTPFITANCDDCNQLLSFPAGFTTTFNGTSYSGAFIGSNTYITFGAGSSAYASLSASNPAIPGLHMCAADNSWQLVVQRTENSGNNLRVRYEGTASTNGTAGSPNIIYEAVFYKGQSYFDVAIGVNARCSSGSSGATNGSTYIATFPTSNALASRYFRIGAAGPTISSVNSSTVDGRYKAGSTVSIQVNFSAAVNVTGTPTLTLETGVTDRTVNCSNGTGITSITCSYTVQAGDTSADLDYASTSALALNGGTIQNSALQNASLALPTPGATGSLGANKAIVIDTTSPTVANVNSSTADGSYRLSSIISIQISFSEAVTVTGTPQLTLETGAVDRAINYVSGSGTSALTFTYTVQAGDTSGDLDYVGTTSLALNGGTIRDAATNDAVLTLATPGATNSLGANKIIVVDTTAPTATVTTATVSRGANTSFQSSEVGTGYIVKSSVTVSSLASITGSADDLWNSATVSVANSSTNMSTLGLQEGDFKFYATDAAGNLSAASAGTITVSIPTCTDSGTTITCSYTGNVQKWVVPTGVTSGRFTVTGAAGGGTTGGFGGVVTGTLALTAGQTLYMYVGQAGSSPSTATTFNGGGSGSSFAASGGGGSDIRTDFTLTNRLVVAGGGGGAGSAAGADAGFTSGANAASGYVGSTGGNGGTQSAGGTGGTGAVSCGAQNGSNGALGIGGNGATSSSGGGGGGGGYYGGGGGGSGCNSNPGGGGSGFVSPTLVTSAGNSLASTRTNGSITIIYVADTLTTPSSVSASATGTAPSGTLKSINLNWASVSNASSYTIRIYDVATGGSAVATITGIANTATSTTITTSQFSGMLDKTTYYITVAAVGNGTTYLTSAESSRASVTTHAAASALSIASQPSSQQKTVGQSITFSVTASATDQGTLSYVWKKGATTIAGANLSSYTFTTISTSDAGDYTVIVTNSLNGSTPTTITSSIATLTMSSALTFNARSNVTVTAGTALSGSTLISVTAINGRTNRTYAVTAGALPTGLALDASTGVIGGTPSVAGTFSGIKITVTDANGATLQMASAFTITVNSGTQLPLSIITRVGTGGQALILATQGGSGNGALTYTLDPLVQPSCLLSGFTLTPNFAVGTSGACYVKVTKAADAAFTATSSSTTTIFFTAYVPVVQQTTTCPAGTTPSAPTGIGVSSCIQVLAPVTTTEGDAGAAPKITGLSATSGLVGATITITGTGLSTVTRVQFGTKATTTFTATATTITVDVPVGATRGRVMVVSPTGSAMAAAIFTVTTLDTQAPGFTGGSVNTSTPTLLTLNFDESIDGAGVSATSFAVLVAGSNRAITGISISGTTITLTLASAVTAGQSVDFTYTSPGDSTSVKDAAGNKTATITSTRLTNNLS